MSGRDQRDIDCNLNLKLTSRLLELLEEAKRCRGAYEVVYKEGFSDYGHAEDLLSELKKARGELGRHVLLVYEQEMQSIPEHSI